MSDAEVPVPRELLRPSPPESWRDRVASFAESLDISPARLVVGVAAVVAVLALGWKLLEPPAPPVEMELPFATTSAPAAPASSLPAAAGSPSGSDGDGEELVVHVAGAVARPGVQRLPPGVRVIDAVDAAGGAVPEADLGRINLAAPLDDGQQVYVPRVGEPGGGAPGEVGSGGPTGSDSGGPPRPIDLNTATVDELDELPGVGPAIAQAIVDHRAQHGDFTSVDDLLDVRGIGQAKLDQLRPLATV